MNCKVRPAAAFTERLYLRPGRRAITRRKRYLTSKALPSHWKKHASFGSDDPQMGRRHK